MATTASLPAYLLPGVAVHQPPHLEGDASLATEILPGPPSSATVQQMALKRDPKKPSLAYSYLPPADPGSTYSGLLHGTLIGQDPEGPRSKRSRLDKGAASRAQRASARQQGSSTVSALDTSTTANPGTTSTTQPITIDSDSGPMALDDDLSLSRSNSSVNLQPQYPPSTIPSKAKRKDKGKGKEVETPPLRVKEEPKSFSLNTPEPPSNLLNNEDHCSSCRSFGSLVYCDGCPKAFHLWCLDPPLEGVDDARWFCPTCVARKHPPRKPPPSLLSAAIHQLQSTYPVEYQLPEDIRTFFKDVASGPKGTYIDSSEIKPPRLNRHGQLEDRDPYRLRDRNGGPVLCFQCGMSALPNNLAASAPAAKRARRSTSKAASPDAWKSIVSCDYCNLHWHLDCLSPPLPTLPPFNKKWMCPNHSERILPPKRRIPKQNAQLIEITKPRQFNNGNIDVIHPQYTSTIPTPTLSVDEVLINGRRYRVPEKVIVLDFWNRLNKWDEHVQREEDIASGLSSPLTSLSSLDDSDDHAVSPSGPMINGELEDYFAAQVLCDLSTARRSEVSHVRGSYGIAKKLVDRSVQTEGGIAGSMSTVSAKGKPGRPRKHPLPTPTEAITNSIARNATNRSSESTNTSTSVTISAIRRRRTSQQVLPEASTRELRSRSRNHNNDTPLTSISSRSSLRQCDESSNGHLLGSAIPASTSTKAKAVNIKMEEVEGLSLMSPWLPDIPATSSSGPSKPPRIIRTPRQSLAKTSVNIAKETKEKRGRKRKTRDDELPANAGENDFDPKDLLDLAKNYKELKPISKDKADREIKKTIRTPSRQQLYITNQDTTPSSSSVLHSPSLSITPSLKIRLPRLSNLNLGSNSLPSSVNPDTPTRR